MHDIDNYHGFITTVMALKLAPYVMLRPSELACLEWAEVREETQQLHIKAERMKMRKPHIVPLSTQAWAVIEEMKQYSGNNTHVYPSNKNPNKSITIDALRLALRGIGYDGKIKPKQDTHGFRHMASTRLYEMASEYELTGDMIEMQLAHSEGNKVKAAYNHAEYIKERTSMMQIWADYLDTLKNQSNVTHLPKTKAS